MCVISVHVRCSACVSATNVGGTIKNTFQKYTSTESKRKKRVEEERREEKLAYVCHCIGALSAGIQCVA